MRKIYSLLIVALFTVIVSCTDDSLDPLNFKSVKKGTLLALRGAFLQNLYVNGEPGAKFIPLIANGTEKFTFDAEFLAEDPSSLASMDIYIEKKPSLERVFLKNVPFSEFKNDGKYPRPWVTVSLPLSDILTKIGITPNYPLSATDVNTLVTTYKFGVNVITDLNLTDGTKVLADDLVAAGLYQSNQFYPAQNLPYTVVNYCAFDEVSWGGSYTANEIYSNSAYGPYTISLIPTGNPGEFTLVDFWDSGPAITAIVQFTASTDPDTQIVKFPAQTVDGADLEGTGTYDECTKTFKIQTKYAGYEWRYEFSQD
jgi:hypothetical protein